MKIKYKMKDYSKIIGKTIIITDVPKDKREKLVNFLNLKGYTWPGNNPIKLDAIFLEAHAFCLTKKMELLYSSTGNPGREFEKDGKFTYKELFNEDKI